MARRALSSACLAAAFLLVSALPAASGEIARTGPDSGLPVPRFVSLKTAGANGRHGPGVQHRIDWIYQRAGLPLEVTAESGPWRRVRDPDGAQVWIHANNLDNRRTIYVHSRDGGDVALRSAPGGGRTLARLAAGVVGPLTDCRGDWRRIAVGDRSGWAPADALWGAPDCGAS